MIHLTRGRRMAAGIAYMNAITVQQASQGLATYVADTVRRVSCTDRCHLTLADR